MPRLRHSKAAFGVRRRPAASGGVRRIYPQQAIQLSVDVQHLVVIIVPADQQDPCAQRRLDCDYDS
jgi:hypothetical protein